MSANSAREVLPPKVFAFATLLLRGGVEAGQALLEAHAMTPCADVRRMGAAAG
jgi:hypothetical protein